MLAYVQKQNGEWLNENCYVAQYGFNRMGYNVKSFENDDIKHIKFTDEDAVFGGINALHNILIENDIKIPEVHNITQIGKQAYARNVFTSTIGDVRNGQIKYPFFIKPLEQFKLFTGFVCKTEFDLFRIPNMFSDIIPVIISEVVEFKSEYRCFILNEKLYGCKNYTGDFKLFPDFNFIENAIKMYKNSPSAYTLDFGILSYGDTELIEINDGYGFGAYGLNPIVFCKMISVRWKEIFKNKNEVK